MKVPKKVWVSALVVVGVGLIVWGALLLRHHSQQVATKRTQQKASISSAQNLDVGNTPSDKLTYYINLGGTYESAGDYDKALEALLNADKTITNRSVDGYSVNLTIARVYTELGDKKNARAYYERELGRIKGTGNTAAEKYIRDLEAKL